MKKMLIASLVICSMLLVSCSTVPSQLKGEETALDHARDSETEATISQESQEVTNQLYSIKATDGNYYLNFYDGNESGEGDLSSSAIESVGIYFSSLKVMREKLLMGDLSASEVSRLKQNLTYTEKGLVFFDVNTLYNVQLPTGWSYDAASLVGNDYRVIFKHDSEEYSGHVTFYTDDDYQNVYDRKVTEFFADKQENIMDDQTSYQGTPCVTYEYDTRGSTLRVILIQFETDNGTREVLLKYCIAHDSMPQQVNTEVPYQIHIYGNDERQHYVISLDMDTAPTLEVLRAFSIVPLEP